MARLPQPVPFLGVLGEAEAVPAAIRGDLGKLRRLQRDGLLRAVEFEKERRLLGVGQAGIAVAGAHLHLVEQFDAGDGNAHLDGHDHRVAGRLHRRECADPAADLFRNPLETQRHRGDHAERAFRSDEEPRQVVAGRGLARPLGGADFLAIGGDDGQRQHIVLHRAVAHRIGAGSARRRHAADRGVRPRIDGEEQAGGAQFRVELLAGHARFDDHVEVLGIDLDNTVHAAEIDGNAAVRRIDLALERRPRPERNDGDLVGGADPDDRLHILRAFDEGDSVGQLRRKIGRGVGMLLAKSLACLESLAELLLEEAEHGGDPLLVANAGLNVVERHRYLSPAKCLHRLGNGYGFVQNRRPVDRPMRQIGRRTTDSSLGVPGIYLRPSGAGWSNSIHSPVLAGSAGTRRVSRI